MGILEFRQRMFADYMTGMTPLYDKALHHEKDKLFSRMNEQQSYFPELREKQALRIVEIGAGSGSNIKYFPKNAYYTAVDPNKYFEKYLMENLQKCSNITFEGYVTAYGEDLSGHFEDESVDCVVVTAVGCSVKDIQKVYKEIQRILAPGGRFYYIEHIRGRKGSWTHFKQKAMNCTGIWPLVACECRIDRDLDYQVTLAGFSSVDQKLFKTPKSMFGVKYFGFRFITQHVSGIAAK